MMPAPMSDLALPSLSMAVCRTQRAVPSDEERTWTVLDGEHPVVEPVEHADG
jgi:hypothetical protein